MRTVSIIAATALVVLVAFKSPEEKRMAIVSVYQGKEVYVMSEPTRKYEVVERINDFGVMLKGCEVQNLVEMFLNKAQRKKLEFDALIVDGNSKASLVKFTE